MDKKFICAECGSEEVFGLAWVCLNDPTKVTEVGDKFFCNGCDRECAIKEEA